MPVQQPKLHPAISATNTDKARRAALATVHALFAAYLLAACGGDGDDPVAAAPPPVASPPPAPESLSITGTAATGAAIAAGAVDAKCATGTGTATTAADGSYTVAVTGGALPCTLRVTAGATVLHSMAAGSGATARANITSATELVVARLAATAPADYHAGFGSTTAVALTAAAVQAAATAVVDVLKAGGVDFSAAGDLITGTLVAANGSTAGNAQDQALDALKAKLASVGTTLADLSGTIARQSPNAAPAAISGTASLPADLLLAPAAPNCPSLRSGRYRLVVSAAGSVPQTTVFSIDAPTLVITGNGETTQLTATGDCSWRTPEGGELVATKAGVLVGRVDNDEFSSTTKYGAVLFPEQTHPLSALAGDWNFIGSDGNPFTGSLSLTADGKASAGTVCETVRACEPIPASYLAGASVVASADGGFNLTEPEYAARWFLYQAGGGSLMLVEISADGVLAFATRKAAVTLPAVGRVLESWNVTLAQNLTAPTPISVSKNTVTSVNTAAGSYERTAVQNFATGATRPESLQINALQEGYTRRLPATGVVHTDGNTSNVLEWVALNLRGMDLSVLALLEGQQLLLAPVKSLVTP